MKPKKLSDLQRDVQTLSGSWKLSPDHKITYHERGLDKEATIKGSLVAAEPDVLVISVTVQEDETHTATGLVKLSGKWQLDEKNRITFSIKRGLDKYDTLTFQGEWKINDNFRVTYKFEVDTKPQWFGTASSGDGLSSTSRGSGKRRRRVTKVTQELVFEGHWDLSEKNCLTYLIGVNSNSAFRFRGMFEGKSLLAESREIRYQVGVEFRTSRDTTKRFTKTIVLFGKWELSDDLALSFELECTDGRKAAISVDVELDLEKFREGCPLLPDKVSVNLTSREGDPLGVEIVLTKDLFEGNVQTFVRFRESLKETAVEAGITIPW